MKKVLFIDRDGTIIKEPAEDYQIDSFDKLEFLPFCFKALGAIVNQLDYELVMVTNQDGLGTDSFPEKDFWPVHNLMLKLLKSEGIKFSNVFIDRSTEANPSIGRKPGTEMIKQYLSNDYDLENSFVIGDRFSDLELAKNIGCKSILIKNNSHDFNEKYNPELSAENWNEIFNFLKQQERKAVLERKTNETDVFVDLSIDGSGSFKISTGLNFFDHMLEQLAKHGLLDLEIKVKGDLHIDEHHTIEDTAIALGWAFKKALRDKRGLMRYGFSLPMDDCLASVSIDFGGRAWLVWDADFKREKIGDFPTEMFEHFFKSFSNAAQCNLNIKVEGKNEHHKIESIFKSFAKAIYMAKKIDTENLSIPSTKGAL